MNVQYISKIKFFLYICFIVYVFIHLKLNNIQLMYTRGDLIDSN